MEKGLRQLIKLIMWSQGWAVNSLSDPIVVAGDRNCYIPSGHRIILRDASALAHELCHSLQLCDGIAPVSYHDDMTAYLAQEHERQAYAIADALSSHDHIEWSRLDRKPARAERLRINAERRMI
jgi:hypothetical protein